MRQIRTAALAAAIAILGFGAAAQTGQVSVEMDKARTLRLPAPAATVIVGNPMVADAGVQDRHTLIITGKSYGLTNLIVLDAQGEIVLSADLVVTEPNAPQTALVSLHRGSSRYSYACASGGSCQSLPMLGDSPAAYDALNQQRAAQLEASRSEAGN